ncbi:MAG: isocitrate/isopropylmalate family dehydrogenase [Gammaproteobacteria bacterium]|nr:isocitrate/isopropylmalate family dehydrogenase [Gammaproteobacteria bacterium]
MSTNTAFDIAVLAGDGIGTEVMSSALAVLDAAAARVGGFTLAYEHLPGGAACYRDTGVALAEETFARAEQADAILFGAMGLPDVRYPDGTEIAPQLDLRFRLALYAGVRPIRAFAGAPRVLADARAEGIDLVIVRESTEGLFASRGKGVVDDDAVARDTMVITRAVCERLFDFSFRLAERRRRAGRAGRVTCVDKANVFTSMAFFRKVFDERARGHPDVRADHHYVDAAALDLVRKPWDFDVMVMENMFGDILSDLAASLVGGMGMAPSGDIGDEHALFQPAHGSAPDIAGKGLANPVAMILSAAMMLDWLAGKHGVEPCAEAAALIDAAVAGVLAEAVALPRDLGGTSGTAAITEAVLERI